MEDGRLLVDRTTVGDFDALAVHASPAMIVFVALRGAFGEPPDLVLSGVNHGPNSGQAVLHSGTVGAALTAASLRVPGMAVSLVGSSPSQWAPARMVTDAALAWFVRHATRPYVLNVNVPDVPAADLRGLKPTTALAGFGAVQAEIGERGQGYVSMTFAEIADEAEADTDVAWLRQGLGDSHRTAAAVPGPVDGPVRAALVHDGPAAHRLIPIQAFAQRFPSTVRHPNVPAINESPSSCCTALPTAPATFTTSLSPTTLFRPA